MFVSFTYRIAGLHNNNGCPTLSATSACYPVYLQNHRVRLHLWERHLKCNQCLYALIRALCEMQLMFVSSAYRITRLHYTYGCQTRIT